MTTRRSDGKETRKKLLEAAGKVFAAKGFRDARVSEICLVAQANIAAVNYHFGSKEGLYIETWRYLFERSIEVHPPDGGVPAVAPIAERLRGRISALIYRILDPSNLEFQIAHKELASPTGLLSEIMSSSIEPLRQAFTRVVREYLGPAATEEAVQLCELSIHAQCFFLVHHRRAPESTAEKKSLAFCALQCGTAAVVEHIIRFSFGGLSAYRLEATTLTDNR